MAQLVEVDRLPETSPTRRTRSSLGQNAAERLLPLHRLKLYFAFVSRSDKCIQQKPARSFTVRSLKNRSRGEVNIFLRL